MSTERNRTPPPPRKQIFVRHSIELAHAIFEHLANRDGHNKRLRRSAEMIARVMGWPARECESWHDDVWLVDSTPAGLPTSTLTHRLDH